MVENLKKSGKYILSLFLTILVWKFISHYVFGIKTNEEVLANIRRHQNSKPIKSEISVDQLLIATVDSINKKCPIVLDSTITLLGVSTFQGRVFQYNCVLNIDTSKYHMDILKDGIRKELHDNFINTETTKDFKHNKVTIVYYYVNNKGNFLFKLTFAPDKYE